MLLLTDCWILFKILYQFVGILFRIFAAMVINEIGLSFPFYCAAYTGCVDSDYRGLCGWLCRRRWGGMWGLSSLPIAYFFKCRDSLNARKLCVPGMVLCFSHPSAHSRDTQLQLAPQRIFVGFILEKMLRWVSEEWGTGSTAWLFVSLITCL